MIILSKKFCKSAMQKNLSTAVIARIQLIEATYLEEFTRWYTERLGFDKVYFVNTEPENGKRIEDIMDPCLRDRFVLLDCPLPKEQQNSVVRYYPQLIRQEVHERYLLNVDCDELLYLPNIYNKISDFLQRNPNYGAFRFHWINIASNANFEPSMLALLKADGARAHDGKNVKMMAEVSQITGVGHHSLDVVSRVLDIPISPHNLEGSPFIAHFIARSKTHTLLKILHQEINSLKSRKSHLNCREHVKSILLCPDGISLGQLPPRILLHMIELLQSERANLLAAHSFKNLVEIQDAFHKEASRKIIIDLFNESLRNLGMSDSHIQAILELNISKI